MCATRGHIKIVLDNDVVLFGHVSIFDWLINTSTYFLDSVMQSAKKLIEGLTYLRFYFLTLLYLWCLIVIL